MWYLFAFVAGFLTGVISVFLLFRWFASGDS
jgi:hypothetical protein